MGFKSQATGGTVTRTAYLTRSGEHFGTPFVDNIIENPDTAWAYFRRYRSRSWYTTPSWRATLNAQGWLPTQPYGDQQDTYEQSYSLRKVTAELGDYITHGVGYGQFHVTMPESLNAAGGDLYQGLDDSLVLDAQYKCLSKARDMKTNVAEFFGDGRKTVRMIRDTAVQLGRAYRHFQRREFRKAADVLGINKPLGSAANRWLEYQYGWHPLLSDAKNLAEKAAQQIGLGGRPPRFTARGKQDIHKFLDINMPNALANYYQGCTGYRWTGDYKATARAGLLLEIEYSWAQDFASIGYGLYDPLLLAWELTPFSFVFDWFIDVGTWLEQASSLQGMKVLTGFYSLEKSSKGTASGGNKTFDNWTIQGPPVTSLFAHRSYSRQPWTGGYLRFRTPLVDGLSAARLTTAASLWKQWCRGDRFQGRYHP